MVGLIQRGQGRRNAVGYRRTDLGWQGKEVGDYSLEWLHVSVTEAG